MPRKREEAFEAPTGWRVSLDFCGTRLAERGFRGEENLFIGEHPAASLVLPGIGGAEGLCALTEGDWLIYAEGLAGEVHLGGERCRFADYAVEGGVRLRPGDGARLHLIDQPDVVLHLRLEPPLKVTWGMRVGIRELGRDLAMGGMFVALFALLLQTPEPIPEIEMEEDEESEVDSSFRRILYASLAEIPPPPIVPVFHRAPVLDVPLVAAAAAVAEADPDAASPEGDEIIAVSGSEPEPEPAGVGLVVSKAEEVVEVVEGGELALVGGAAGDQGAATVLEPGEGEQGVLAAIEDAKVLGALSDDLGGGDVLSAREEPALLGVLGALDPDADDAFLSSIGTDSDIEDLFAEGAIGTLGRGGGGGNTDGVIGTVDEVDTDILAVEGGVVGGVVGGELAVAAGVGDELADGADADGADKERPTTDRGIVLPSVLDEPGDPDEPPTTDLPTKRVVGGISVAPTLISEIVCDDPNKAPKDQVDVVFVIDVSTTMGSVIERVGQGIVEVDATLRGLGKSPSYGLVVFVDDVELAKGGAAFTSIEELQAELVRWRTFTGSNRQIHSEAKNTDWPENSLDALHSAAVGFAWRPAATTARLVVHATDDTFGEAPTVQSGQAVKRSYTETLGVLRANQIRVSSFGATIGGECECLDVRPGILSPYKAMPSIPTSTGGIAYDLDEVAGGRLSLASAVQANLSDALCTDYPPPAEPSGRAASEKPPTWKGIVPID